MLISKDKKIKILLEGYKPAPMLKSIKAIVH